MVSDHDMMDLPMACLLFLYVRTLDSIPSCFSASVNVEYMLYISSSIEKKREEMKSMEEN